jgi:hypothetical protein
MKNILFIISILSAVGATAQPVFQNANEKPGKSFTAAVTTGTFSGGPGNAGVNQVWDFRAMAIGATGSFVVLDALYNIYMNNYPNANYVYIIDSAYNYFIVSGTKMEQVTRNISSPGGITDYSQNPKTIMEFPFSWHAQFSDTYMGYGDTARTVTVRYDGYGTLRMPNGDYHNIARVSETYATGVDYVWYSEDPFLPVLRYNHNGGLFTHIAISPSMVNQINTRTTGISIYPNPATSTATININLQNESYGQLRLYDITGRLMLEDIITARSATINISSLPPGIYICKISIDGNSTTGKLIKQ